MINEQELITNNHQNDQSLKNGNYTEPPDVLMKTRPMKTFGDYLLDELSRNNLILNQFYADLVRSKLNEYDQFNLRRFEEKDQFINQLKQNLMDLTEKRFRALNNTTNGPSSEHVDANSLNTNLKFVLNEKDNQISSLLKQLNDYETEIDHLKATIKDQDNIILSHNNNIYEIKNNNETVLKAKQESFRMMNDDLSRKQKFIDEQNIAIKSFKEKIESLEEQHTQSRLDLEKRLKEKEIDLQTKIAMFEANLHEGRHYFEEILKEKETVIKDKTVELNNLKQKLNKLLDDGSNQLNIGDNSMVEDSLNTSENNTSSANTSLQKFDAENLKNIKSLYEHQIELLKVKIEMLEKTCNNYQKGIKEMNKSFGQQQQTDEMTSMAAFKELMQQMHKTNAQLETERIELEVKADNFKKELEQVRVEKENLNRKFNNADQLSQRLQSERNDVEKNFKRQLDLKHNELIHLNNELTSEKTENEKLKSENEVLIQSMSEYEQLKLNHNQLTQHYEQLYNQASEIVTGNQVLNEQVQASALQIQQLNQLVEDYQLKIDHLEHCNSELNTQKINLDMKLVAVENKLSETETDLKELNLLRNSKMNAEKLNQLNKDLELDILEKNELIEQLNQAKDFLAENNSKLLTNNIRIQLFIESMGLELSSLESNATVNEYDSLRSEFKEAQYQLNEIKILNQQLEINQQNFKDMINNKELEIKSLLNQLNDMKSQLEALNSIVKSDACEQTDLMKDGDQTNSLELVEAKKKHNEEMIQLNKQYSEQIAQYEANFDTIQNENEMLNTQLEQTRLELNELKLKYEDSVKEKSNTNSEKLLNELNAVKSKYEETLQKENNLEQLNLKLKAKLKQLLKQQQQSVSLIVEKHSSTPLLSQIPQVNGNTNTISTQTETFVEENKPDQPVEISTEYLAGNLVIENNLVVSLSAENLVSFGSKIASCDLHDHVSRRVDELKNGMTLFLLNNELKIQAAYKEAVKSKDKAKLLENELNHKLNEIIALNSEIDRLKLKINEQNSSNHSLVQEVKQTDNFDNLINELRENLNKKTNELNSINELFNKKTIEHENLLNEFNNINMKSEQLNLQINEFKLKETNFINEIDTSKTKYDSLRLKTHALKEKLKKSADSHSNLNDIQQKHQEELDQLNKIYSDQLVQFELNFNNIQNENESLRNQFKELSLENHDLNLKFQKSIKEMFDVSLQTDLINIEDVNIINQKLVQYEIDYKAIHDEKELLKNQFEKTQFELNDLKFKYEENFKEKKSVSEELNNELNEIKAKYDETLLNQANLEQINLKLKDILKQQQQSVSLTPEQQNSNSTSTLSPNLQYIDSYTNTSTSSSKNSGLHIEAQLKFCHEKCETVVEKLNLLKKQNETLSSKIKSFKSFI